MTAAHKIIKYLAYALAASIIGGFIFGFLGLLSGLSNIIDKKNDSKMITTSYENIIISLLEVELSNTNLTIKTGDYLKIDTNNKDLTFKQADGKLYIKEKSLFSFWNLGKEDLIVYIPNGILFSNILLKTGAGNVDIENLNTNKFSFNIGAGNLEIKSLNVIDNAYIKCGAGKVNILDSSLNNLNFDLGVGKTDITAKISGINTIKTGVGELNMNLTDTKENYKISTSKGIGKIRIDDTEISNDSTYGNGNSYIKLEGEIGNININFK